MIVAAGMRGSLEFFEFFFRNSTLLSPRPRRGIRTPFDKVTVSGWVENEDVEGTSAKSWTIDE